MKISFVVVALNEASMLPSLLEDLTAQDYPHENIEVLLIDSMSTDGTYEIMQQFAQTSDMTTHVLRNPKKWLAAGCNIAIENASGDALIRLDAHAHIPSDFLSKNVTALESGQDIVGGAVLSAPAQTAKEALMRSIDTSRFCGGAAAFRNTGVSRYVDTLAYFLCRKDVFLKVGQYNEDLQRTEDNDYNYRIRKAGYRFYYDPSILSWHFSRGSLKGQLHQKWGNGLWIGRTLWIQPGCFAPRHLIPLFFVLTTLVLLAVSPVFPLPLIILFLLYAVAAFSSSAGAAIESPVAKPLIFLVSPFLFFLVHLTYGISTLVGLMTPVKNRRK